MAVTRYRCTSCGNLTRFDVVVTRKSRSFHHYTVGGQLTIEHEDVLSEVVEEVSCRWCGHGKSVETIPADEANRSTAPDTPPAETPETPPAAEGTDAAEAAPSP